MRQTHSYTIATLATASGARTVKLLRIDTACHGGQCATHFLHYLAIPSPSRPQRLRLQRVSGRWLTLDPDP